MKKLGLALLYLLTIPVVAFLTLFALAGGAHYLVDHFFRVLQVALFVGVTGLFLLSPWGRPIVAKLLVLGIWTRFFAWSAIGAAYLVALAFVYTL